MAINVVSHVDLDLQDKALSSAHMGKTIMEALSVKGFCVIQPNIDVQQLDSAQADLTALDVKGRFQQPPELLLEGLLGMSGSARIAEIDLAPDGDSGVSYFDTLMTDMSLAVGPFLQNMQLEVKARTAGIVHEAGVAAGEGPELDEETCAKWVTVFAHHVIMCIWALGPASGNLELQPFDEDSNSHSVPMKPGTFVMLRADALSHFFTSTGRAYCLTCWLQRDSHICKHRDNTAIEITPCCGALEAWAEAKIKEYKESFPEERAQMKLPRHWETVMTHTNYTNQHIAVRTCAIRQVPTYDQIAWAGAFQSGPDFGQEIPIMRFEIDWHYDPNPDAFYYHKTCCKHGSFIEGTELFDNAAFRISKSEAGGMDPGHRLTMETGYEALIRDGYKISTIMNTRGGVYVANPPPAEWGMAEKNCSAGGVCGGGGSIACGRFSFVHGLKGPCISVDVESASSLVAVNFCAVNLSRTGRWEPIPYGVVQTWNLLLHPSSLVHASAAKRVSPTGRTFSFDASANGFVRGECAESFVLKAATSVVDDQLVINEGNCIGDLVAFSVVQSGKRASITSPDGSAMQEAIYEAVNQADISPLDVDACDLSSDGAIMHDAAETTATAKAYRPENMEGLDETPPIAMISGKTNWGNHIEADGLTTILKITLGSQWGSNHPHLHLRLLNPYIDLDYCCRSAQIETEALEFRLASSYYGLANRSMSGTNCHCITWGQLNDMRSRLLPEPSWHRDKIFFWPEGGGQLEDDQVAKRVYSIIGTFNSWEPEAMEKEQGFYTATVTLGENRWERFQVILDSDARRVLYPSYDRVEQTTKGAPVAGPKHVFHSDSWTIDTRHYFFYGTADTEATVGVETGVNDCQDAGQPGDRFKIRLKMKGKWRMVDWENLDRGKAAGAAPAAPVPTGSYQISGSWDHGIMKEMAPDESVPGKFSTEVTLMHEGASSFQIFRNRDWGQAIYPDYPMADSSAYVLGPDEQIGNTWMIEGHIGGVFKVDFQRAIEEGLQTMKVEWTLVRTVELTTVQRESSMRPMFFIVGTWDDTSAMHRMHWTGEYFQFYVQLGASSTESFHLHQNGHPRRCIYPAVPNAHPFERHDIQGPDSGNLGLRWTIGFHTGDEAAPGKRYEIRLRINDESLRPEKLDWIPVKGIAGLEDAKGKGFLVIGQ